MFEINIFKLPVRINFYFVAMVCIFLLTDETGISFMGLLACTIHELGHVLAFAAVGQRPSLLSLEMTGIRLVNPNCTLSRAKEFFVLISGSGLNLLIFMLLCAPAYKGGEISLFGCIHLVLGLFNLLPVKSFDGGKIFYLAVSAFLPFRAAEIVSAVIDLICVIIMLLFCGALIVKTGGSFTLLVMSVYLLIASLAKLYKSKKT